MTSTLAAPALKATNTLPILKLMEKQKAYPMSAECEKYLRHVLGRPGMDHPIGIDDAADLLPSLGNIALAEIFKGDGIDPKMLQDEDTGDAFRVKLQLIKKQVDGELDVMEIREVGPWIEIALGEFLPDSHPGAIVEQEWEAHSAATSIEDFEALELDDDDIAEAAQADLKAHFAEDDDEDAEIEAYKSDDED